MATLNPIPAVSESSVAATSVVLAEGVDAKIECIRSPGGAILRKTYKTAPLLRWRTAFRRSRARREFENLRSLAQRHVPVVEAIDWTEQRAFGCTVRSVLTTRFVDCAQDLRSIIRNRLGIGLADCAIGMGDLLRQLHAGGLTSTTASPRNVLVTGGVRERRLLFCDQPHLVPVGKGAFGRQLRDVDLFDTFFSASRRRDWTKTERWRGVLAYCGGDRDAARATWRRLQARRPWLVRVVREIGRAAAQFHKNT